MGRLLNLTPWSVASFRALPPCSCLYWTPSYNIWRRTSWVHVWPGGFAHADDIRTLCTSRDTLDSQIGSVEEFVANALSLHASKYEVGVVSSQNTPAEPICIVKGRPLFPVASAKCLGYWWSWDLSADKSIDSAIGRARSSFFAFGAMGGFQGKLNPLSGRAIIETCVVPRSPAYYLGVKTGT